MSFPKLPDCMFPNTVTIRLCDDAGNFEGGFNPVAGESLTVKASVQDFGVKWSDDLHSSIIMYRVSLQSDPNLSLSRPLRAGDQIEWTAEGITLNVEDPRKNRGGYSFVWRVDCTHVKS